MRALVSKAVRDGDLMPGRDTQSSVDSIGHCVPVHVDELPAAGRSWIYYGVAGEDMNFIILRRSRILAAGRWGECWWHIASCRASEHQ